MRYTLVQSKRFFLERLYFILTNSYSEFSYYLSFTEPLYTHVKEASLSSWYSPTYTALRAFDGIMAGHNFAHTGEINQPHWIKAVFKECVFIYWIEFFNRVLDNPDALKRSNNIDLYTILHVKGQSIESWFGNTEILGYKKKFSCMQYADAIIVRQPTEKSADMLNVAEISMFGRIPKNFP